MYLPLWPYLKIFVPVFMVLAIERTNVMDDLFLWNLFSVGFGNSNRLNKPEMRQGSLKVTPHFAIISDDNP